MVLMAIRKWRYDVCFTFVVLGFSPDAVVLIKVILYVVGCVVRGALN